MIISKFFTIETLVPLGVSLHIFTAWVIAAAVNVRNIIIGLPRLKAIHLESLFNQNHVNLSP